ncbi:hypothetical protein KCU99_g4863, partial [Aureobasidium melanogenum]
MAAPQRPEQGHSRYPSSDTRRVAMPRRSTKGPLDVDVSAIPSFQPPTPALQTALPPSPAPASMPMRTASPASSLLSPVQQNPASVRTRSKSPAARTMQLDLSLLLRPSLYAPVPTTHLASPFLDSSTQPPPDTDLETLLSQRRFIHAADKATDILTSGSIPPSSTQRILDLLYTRFSCLVLCNQSSLAAKEAKPLSELLARESSSYTRPHREVFLSQVPWSLRLLLLKLSVLGTADLHRRAIMGLYGLSSECRVLAQKARVEKDDTAFKLWKYRLGDLGLRVAGELIEMGELETAKRHLDTLSFAAAAASTDNADDDTNGKIEKMLIFLLDTLNTFLNPAIPNPGTPLALLNLLLRPRPLIFTLPHRAASLKPTAKTQPRNRIPLHQQRHSGIRNPRSVGNRRRSLVSCVVGKSIYGL